MSCNAHNHRPGCNCGWGGDTGGGGGFRATVVTSVGRDWPPLGSTFVSFVNPNAKCPVCGAGVYFYQSPFGGRVFFDELGPPWPKHRCTDRGYTPTRINWVSGSAVELPGRKQSLSLRPSLIKEGWTPLLARQATKASANTWGLHGTDGVSGQAINLGFTATNAIQIDGPIFYRRLDVPTEIFEISYIVTPTAHVFSPHSALLAPDAKDWGPEAMAHLGPAVRGDGEAANTIGWMYSFDKIPEGANPKEIAEVERDWEKARLWYELGCANGSVSAAHNLAIIYLFGLGVEKDPEAATGLLQIGAGKQFLPSLKRLVECYSLGLGCDQNSEKASRLQKIVDGLAPKNIRYAWL